MKTCILLLLTIFLSVLTNAFISAQTRSAIDEMDRARRTDPENLNVFHQWIRNGNGGSFLAKHLMDDALLLYERRDDAILLLKTREDWIARQKEVRKTLLEILGPFPERTNLKPIVTGTIVQEGYRIEKIVYQSMPDFYVTGCIYIPDTDGNARMPAVLNLIGHEQESFRAELNQVVATNLAKKGMVVLTIDPPGQGEHVQYFNEEKNFSSIGYSVAEHCYFGNQSFLSGVSSAMYFIWDAIRAIDYLTTRDEVDASRIGVTGFSGGGTITSYVSALDERVRVSVPSSWSTSSRRQIETKGAQDAEANLIHGLHKGITFEDLIELRAPKPTLMTFVSRDEYLTMQGARDAYAEAKEVYGVMGEGDNLELVEDNSRHWLTPKIREAIYGFFIKHFGIDADLSEEQVNIFSHDQLQVTKTGQVASSYGGKMIFDVNQERTKKLINRIAGSRKSVETHLREIPLKAKEISGFRTPRQTEEVFINGCYERPGYTVTKYALTGEGHRPLPVLLFVPDGAKPKSPAIIYIHPEGKDVQSRQGGEIEKLVKKGYIVAASDVSGVGELRNTATTPIAINYTAILIGRSVVGIQAEDIVRVVNYLQAREDVDSAKIGAYALGVMTIPLLHAAAFSSGIAEIALMKPLISYRCVATNRIFRIGLNERKGGGTHHPYDIDFSWGIAGVLTAYDLPDLIGCLAPRRIFISEFVDQDLKPASRNLVKEETVFPLEAYAFKEAKENITIKDSVNASSAFDWFFR